MFFTATGRNGNNITVNISAISYYYSLPHDTTCTVCVFLSGQTVNLKVCFSDIDKLLKRFILNDEK